MSPQQRKELAIQLREAGCTYKEIAQQTEYSLDWCKRELKAVEKNSAEKAAIKEAIHLAQSKQGITVPQITRLVRSVYPYESTKAYQSLEEKAANRFRYAINHAPNTLIRPYWMHPTRARDSFNLLLSSVDSLMLRMNDTVDHIRRELNYDQSFDISLRHAIVKMLLGSNGTPEGIELHCDRHNNTVLSLESRNLGQDESDATLSAYLNKYPEKCAPNKARLEECDSVEFHHPVDDLISLDELFPDY